MGRPRQRTEHLGFQATKPEAEAFKDYLRQRKLSASECLRQMVLQAIGLAVPEGPVDDAPAA